MKFISVQKLSNGRVTIPKWVRDKVGLVSGWSTLSVTVDGKGRVILTPVKAPCVFCGEEHSTHFHGKAICAKCYQELTGNKAETTVKVGRKKG